MVGPTGIGVLYGKRELLEAMPPWMGGGDMISRVRLEGSTWNDLPYKFEAGTPAIAEAIGLGHAVDYLSTLGMEKIHAHEQAVTQYALDRLAEVPGLTVFGPPDAAQKGGVAAFKFDDIHAHDVAQILPCVRVITAPCRSMIISARVPPRGQVFTCITHHLRLTR
jgi:cysteine desulfurase/selenocysteine lyase